MSENSGSHHQTERRADVRTIADHYYSVEFTLPGLAPVYQFKLWNLSKKGMCILVKEDSAVVNHLSVGDKLSMKYYLSSAIGATEMLTTEIKHVTKNDQGRFKGHYLVGLSILDRQRHAPPEEMT